MKKKMDMLYAQYNGEGYVPGGGLNFHFGMSVQPERPQIGAYRTDCR